MMRRPIKEKAMPRAGTDTQHERASGTGTKAATGIPLFIGRLNESPPTKEQNI